MSGVLRNIEENAYGGKSHNHGRSSITDKWQGDPSNWEKRNVHHYVNERLRTNPERDPSSS